MKNTLSLFVFLSLFLITVRAMAQCAIAEKYVADIQNFQDNATPTEYASSGKKISAWTQFATWNTYKCQCDSPENLSDSEIPQLVNAMNATRGIISKEYSTYGTVPRVYKVSDCKKGNSNSTNSASSKTSTQIEMEQRFRNYNNAMNLKRQGENIAKAYAQQIKSYGELNETNSPEALLQNFNNNMQAIADLQTQNKADNLNQLTNTLSSTINDLNSGNHEGAMFSALSLLDQGDAKREARREAERIQQNLIYQTQEKMTAFYMKAVELNDQAIKQYNEKAAYAYSKEEETYLLEYVSNLECHKEAMKSNFSYSNTSWTQNRCAIPEEKTYTVNNLIAKDIQYINAAKRKYALYEKTGEPIFQQGAMRFAGLAATENPKADYYYLMGHFAGINNPLVAYSSFLTVKSKNTKFFEGDKNAEYSLIKLSLEASLKTAIDENDQEVIKNIVGASLHKSVEIDNNSPIIYAMKIDQADVVYAFLNTELKGKSQSIITKKVQEVIMMSVILDAPNTIEKFVDLGFSVDFTIDGKTPLDVAEEALAIKSFNKVTELLGGQSKYNTTNSDLIVITDKIIVNSHTPEVVKPLYESLRSPKAKSIALKQLLTSPSRKSFFNLIKQNPAWAISNNDLINSSFYNDLINRNQQDVFEYVLNKLVSINSNGTLSSNNSKIFINSWREQTLKEFEKYNMIQLYRGNMGYQNDNHVLINRFNPEWTPDYIEDKENVNLIEFAIFSRRDLKLTKALLELYTYTPKPFKDEYKNAYNLKYILGELFLWFDIAEYETQGLKPGQTEFAILNTLLDYGIYVNEKIELSEVFARIYKTPHKSTKYQYTTKISFVESHINGKKSFLKQKETYEALKKYLDRLHSLGYPCSRQIYINDLDVFLKAVDGQSDQKYWKSFFKGKYIKSE